MMMLKMIKLVLRKKKQFFQSLCSAIFHLDTQCTSQPQQTESFRFILVQEKVLDLSRFNKKKEITKIPLAFPRGCIQGSGRYSVRLPLWPPGPTGPGPAPKCKKSSSSYFSSTVPSLPFLLLVSYLAFGESLMVMLDSKIFPCIESPNQPPIKLIRSIIFQFPPFSFFWSLISWPPLLQLQMAVIRRDFPGLSLLQSISSDF